MGSQDPRFVVLMADDDEDDCVLVQSAFRDMGVDYDLHFVADGRELLDYLHNARDFADPQKYPRPNLIFLDLNMPRIDGREALAIIKSDSQLKNIPILILTTSLEERDITLAREAGASSFLSKPVRLRDLTDLLNKFCEAIQRDPKIPFQVIG